MKTLTFYSAADLAEALREAETAHKAAEAATQSGPEAVPVHDWANWYAHRLFETEGAEFTVPEGAFSYPGSAFAKGPSYAAACHVQPTTEALAACIVAVKQADGDPGGEDAFA